MQKPACHETILVEKAITGDADAFGELYQHYLPALYRYIYQRVGNINDAEDLTEQVFLKAWEALPGYHQRGYPFAAWLYRIGHNAIIDYHRRCKQTIPLAQLPQERWWDRQRSLPEQIIAAEEVAELSTALAQLPEEQQQVISLRFAEGLNHEEVGRAINKSAGASRMIQLRAIQTLGQLLKKPVAKTTGALIAALFLLFISARLVLNLLYALPGDTFYPMKRTLETIQLNAAQTSLEKAHWHLTLATRRINEAVQLQEQQRFANLQPALTAYSQQLQSVLLYLGRQSAIPVDEQASLVNTLVAVQLDHERHMMQLLAHASAATRPFVETALKTSQEVRRSALDTVFGNPSVITPVPSPTQAEPTSATPTTTQPVTGMPTATYVLQPTPILPTPTTQPAPAVLATTPANAVTFTNTPPATLDITPPPTALLALPNAGLLGPTDTPTPVVVFPPATITPLSWPTDTPTPPLPTAPPFTPTATDTPLPLPTSTPVLPTATAFAPPPTATLPPPIATATLPIPTATATLFVPTATDTPLSPTATATLPIPTPTATLFVPTATDTPLSPTATATLLIPTPTATLVVPIPIPDIPAELPNPPGWPDDCPWPPEDMVECLLSEYWPDLP